MRQLAPLQQNTNYAKAYHELRWRNWPAEMCFYSINYELIIIQSESELK